MKLLLIGIIIGSLLTGCGTPVTFSGAYQDDHGDRYEAGATFTLPAKKGYAK